MRAINHAVTGALIGLTITQPAVALPVALVSHYALDALPHFDLVSNKLSHAIRLKSMRSKLYKYFLVADAVLCFGLVLTLYIAHPQNWWLAAVCAFVAAAPDFISIKHYLYVLQHKPWKAGLYNRFAGAIQWFERPIGAVVEIGWFIAIAILLLPFLR